MNFESEEDIGAPIEAVFAALSDVRSVEARARARGITVTRLAGDPEAPAAGMAWTAGFRLQGKPREMRIDLTRYAPPNTLIFDSRTGGLGARAIIDLAALSDRRTRLNVDVALVADSLPAKLLLQSLKLTRGKIDKRFRLRMAEYARDLEARLTQA